MINKSRDIQAALSAIPEVKKVSLAYPDSFADLPRVSFFEANNSPAEFSDDCEYLSELNFQIDVWAEKWDDVYDIAIDVDDAMSGIGFTREFSADVPDDQSNIKHKTMRYQFIGG